jgi:ATP-dependent RNA helicase DeaD
LPFPTLPAPIASALEAKGYAEPTPVQEAVLAAETAGRDLLVSAQTGSGKTVAFGLAVVPNLLGDAARLGPPRTPLALVIAPTRELALQVQSELAWLYAGAGARVVACVGGTDMRAERRALDMGAHIVVGTPGRLRDHIERGSLVLSALAVAVTSWKPSWTSRRTPVVPCCSPPPSRRRSRPSPSAINATRSASPRQVRVAFIATSRTTPC